jgi:hypothetical protein
VVERIELGKRLDRNEWDLHLMFVAATKDLLDVGRNLVIVALIDADLHIRIFDASGKKVVDKVESELISGEILTALKKRLNPFPDEFSLSKEDKQEIIRNATSIAGHTHQEAIPFACIMTGEEPLQPPENRLIYDLENHLVYDLAARKFLSTLLFYEGIRQIIGTGCGVRCPVRSMEWAERAFARIKGNKLPTCCGRSKELIALWEAGDKAKKLGLFKPHKWDRPHECM